MPGENGQLVEVTRRRRFSISLVTLATLSFGTAVVELVLGHRAPGLIAAVAGVWVVLVLLGLRGGITLGWAALWVGSAVPTVFIARSLVTGGLDALGLLWLLSPVLGLAVSPSLPHTLGELAESLQSVRGPRGSLERLRSQLMIVTLVISAFAALTTAPGYWLVGLHLSALMTGGFGVCLIGLTMWYRAGWGARRTWLTLLALTWVAVSVDTLVEAPLQFSSILYCLVFPISGFVLVGEREGVVGALAAALLVVVVSSLHGRLPLPEQAPVPFVVLLVRAIALVIGLSLFTGASERLRLLAFEESERAQKARTLFLANISHELRTPMNGVLGLTDLLLSDSPRADQREHLELIARSGQSLLTVISDVLSLTSLESGAVTLAPSPVVPHDIVHDVVALLHPMATKKRLVLEVQGELPTPVMLDSTRLRQILSNLIGNAIKFTDEGSVVVRLSSTPGALTLIVDDTGAGIPLEGRAGLFKPFHQADPSSTRRHGGTGLGLAISRQLARAMGGELTYEPRTPIGSTFKLVLPA